MIKPFSTTGIGSLPLLDPEEACRLVLHAFDIPFWPQLPKLSFREFMVPQYSEGMPFFRIDEERQTAWVERGGSDELERFYEGWKEGCRIALSEDYARGLHTFLRLVRNKKFAFVKGHVTGPLTFSLGLKDAEGKPIYYDEELREISLMLLKAKTRWQIDALKSCAEKVIIFIYEPILSALGSSAYLGVSQEESLRLIREMTAAIGLEGAISGIHCCGNADWPLVIGSGSDIINFDAYGYVDTVSLYPEEFKDFLEKGGVLAWGIVPTSDAITRESPESVKEKFEAGIQKLSGHIPESLLLSRIILTPSCGTGSRSIEETLKVFQILMRLKEALT
jgi:methionine synthase II (cobalamin-independent)